MKEKNKAGKLPGGFLFNLILFGLMGQIAWNVENMYFNTFLYNAIYAGASQRAVDGSLNVFDAVSKMVAFSAVTAVLTTFLMGTLSDKLGSRRRFISVGYIIWGAITGAFGFISRENVALLFHLSDEIKILTAAVWLVIVMDCLMTFVGSTANDASFNAWVTDATNARNRASAESLLSILPLAATGIVLGLGGALLAGEDKHKSYAAFFTVLGTTVVLCGVIGLFTLKDAPKTVRAEGSYLRNLIYGMRPSVIKSNAKLYLTLLAICAYSIAVQVFFPYLIIYLEHSPDGFFSMENLQLSPALIAIAAAAVVLAVAGIIGAGKLIDRYGKDKFILPVLVLMVGGLFLLYFAHSLPMLIVGAAPTAVGYCMIGIMLNAAIRDFTPEGKAGLFQGVRMIFFVMLPMVIGPLIGKNAILSSGATYLDEYGTTQPVPTSAMFLYAGIACAFAFVPVVVILLKGGFSAPQAAQNETEAAEG